MKRSLFLLPLIASSAWAQNQITNHLGMVFMEIPAGEFMMGADEKATRPNERPEHKEVIDKPFYLARFEVTQAEWKQVMGEEPNSRCRMNFFLRLLGKESEVQLDHPAAASWNDAQEFIAKLNAQDDKYHYRLPTEVEWEYAAHSGFPTARFLEISREKLAEYCWFEPKFGQETHPVGSKKASVWGIYDLCGNASEWVEDNYRPDYNSEPTNKKTVRGGSWHSTKENWQPTRRFPKDADYRGKTIGFRLVAEQKTTAK